MERVPQVLESVTLRARKPLEDMASLQRLIAQGKTALGKEGRLLVRWSGTEPKLRVMVEGPDEERIGTIAQELVAAARGVLSSKEARSYAEDLLKVPRLIEETLAGEVLSHNWSKPKKPYNYNLPLMRFKYQSRDD